LAPLYDRRSIDSKANDQLEDGLMSRFLLIWRSAVPDRRQKIKIN